MRNSEKNRISYFLIIVLMLFSQNTLLFSPLAQGRQARFRTIIYLVLLAMMIAKTMVREWINRYSICGIIFFAGTVFSSMLWHGDSGAEYWLIVMALSFLLVSNYDMPDLAKKYNQIMRILCIIFLFGFFLLSVKPALILSPTWIKLEEWEVVYSHSSMLRFYQAGIVPMRAYGIFREPGVYQMYVILAMLICLYLKKNFLADILIYSLAVLTTHSTTGYICLVLVYGVMILKLLSIKNRKTIIILLGIFGVGLIISPRLISNVVAKFTATGGDAHSWMSRAASFASNIYLWLKNPLLGIGMNGVAENFAYVTKNVFGLNAGGIAITDDTNSILIYFAAYGLVPGIIFCVGIWKGIRKVEKSFLRSLMVMLIFVCLFAGEQVNNTCYPYVLIFWGLAADRLKSETVTMENQEFPKYNTGLLHKINI